MEDRKVISFLQRAGCDGGGKGILITEDRTNCLATMLQPKICYCIQGNAIDRKDQNGCGGKGWRERERVTR